MAIYTIPAIVTACDVLSTTYLNSALGNLELLSVHDHSPSAGEGNSILESTSGVGGNVPAFYISPNGRPNTNMPLEVFSSSAPTGQIPDITTASEMLGGVVWGFQITRPTAINDWYGWQVPILKGVYSIQFMYLPAPNGGAASVELGTSGLGLVDTYAASAGSTLITTLVASVNGTGSKLLRVIQTSSNALSSSNITKLGIISIRRTENMP